MNYILPERSDHIEKIINHFYTILSKGHITFKAADLPILSNMLALWNRSNSTLWCVTWGLFDNKKNIKMPSFPSRGN